jgi:hypothetical protein
MTNDNQNAGKSGINTDASSTAPQWAEERVRLQLLIGEFLNALKIHNEAVCAAATEIGNHLAGETPASQNLAIAESMMKVLNASRTLHDWSEALITCTEKLLGTFPTTGYTH